VSETTIQLNKNMVVFITGPRHSGKTALTAQAAAELRRRGQTVGGILSPAEFENGKKQVYFVQSIASGTRRPLLRLTARGPKIAHDGFAFANNVLARSAGKKVVFIDEFGPLEMQEKGFWPQARRLCLIKNIALAITVRPSLARLAPQKLSLKKFRTIALNRERRPLQKLLKLLQRHRKA